MGKRIIIDGHIHCGPRRIYREGRFELWHPIERVKEDLAEAGAQGAVLFPLCEDISRKAYATAETAKAAHEYILNIAKENEHFFPFYFVWNDFVIPENLSDYKGIKWHRHDYAGFAQSEPEYDYSDPKCDEFVEAVREYDLPVILEESFENTKLFCNKYPDIKTIIPHVGTANDRPTGGMRIVSEFKNYPNVYLGTSLAHPMRLVNAIVDYGPDRVIFGSDSPFSSTKIELANVTEHYLMKKFSDEDIDKVLGKNILKLMKIEA